jgi:hypothetical protein
MPPTLAMMSPMDAPGDWLSLDTSVSAGCDTTAQSTPAM